MLNPHDYLGEHIQDYDIVWFATPHGHMGLACIKQVRTPFRRVNPNWHYRTANTGVDRHITGIEDKFLVVFSLTADLTCSTPGLSTTRVFALNNCVKVVDPWILNSNLVQVMLDKTKKTNK